MHWGIICHSITINSTLIESEHHVNYEWLQTKADSWKTSMGIVGKLRVREKNDDEKKQKHEFFGKSFFFVSCKIFHEMTIELNFRSVHKNQYWVNKAIEMSRYFKCRFLSIYLFNLSFVRCRSSNHQKNKLSL